MGKIHTRMMPLALAVALTACGGGGGGSASSGNGSGSGSAQLVTSTTLNGVAVDGYLQNAKVCLDLNDNLVCDSGEPSATTGANGSYSLTAPSLEAANSHRVIVEAVAGTTIDADAPGAPIGQSYVLVAPIGQHAVVSPIGTLLHHLQQRGQTQTGAQTQLRQLLALSDGVDLRADFAAPGASAEQQYLHDMARVVARQLATGLTAVQSELGRPLSMAEKPAALA